MEYSNVNHARDEFLAIYRENIKREGSKELLNYIMSTDFFTAPASSKFHNNFRGGLCEHSINVYKRLKKLCEIEDEFYGKYSDETIAIIGLLHDLCKANFYTEDFRNVKEDGVWVSKPYYKIEEAYPFGHGEKSVYLIMKYMLLTNEEALAINWHMGPYDDRVKGGSQVVSAAFHKCHLAFLTHIADSMATYLDEDKDAYENYL